MLIRATQWLQRCHWHLLIVRCVADMTLPPWRQSLALALKASEGDIAGTRTLPPLPPPSPLVPAAVPDLQNNAQQQTLYQPPH